MLSAVWTLLAGAATTLDAPAKPEQLVPEPPAGRLLTVEEMTSIIQAELVRQPKLTVGEVREYVTTRMAEMRRQTVPVATEPPPAPTAELDVLPAKTRRRRERLAARARLAALSSR